MTYFRRKPPACFQASFLSLSFSCRSSKSAPESLSYFCKVRAVATGGAPSEMSTVRCNVIMRSRLVKLATSMSDQLAFLNCRSRTICVMASSCTPRNKS